MKTSDAAAPDGGGIARLESLAGRLREAALRATIRHWDTSFYFEVPGFVLAKAPTVHLDMLVAEATHQRDARVVALCRDVAPIFVSSLEVVAATARNAGGRPMESVVVEQMMSGAWSDETSRWKWGGWDPATGAARVRPEGPMWRDEWNSPPKLGAVNRGSRSVDIPRNSLTTSSPGLWTLVIDPDQSGDPHVLADRDGTIVAHFRRPEDAVFSVIAREVVSVFGAAYEALGRLIDADVDGTIDPDLLLNTIADSTPWPLEATPETSPEEGRQAP